jgi:subtilisin family serine protease
VSRALRKALSAASCAAAVTLAFASCSDPLPTAAPDGPSLAKSAPAQDDPVVPGEVLVAFKDGVDPDAKIKLKKLKSKAKGYKNAFDVVESARGNERALAAALAGDPDVEWAEPNYIRQVDAIDSRLWAFYNPGGLNMQYTSGGTGDIPASYASLSDADQDNLEGIGGGGVAVVIGSIDTGVDYDHPEFTGRLIRGCDWYDQAAAGNSSATCTNFSSDDTPDEGHGTHTTGTMAGTRVGVSGVTGAGTNVKVLVQRVCGPVGCYTSAIINAVRAAADYPGMVAMNLSLGGSTESAGEKSAIKYAVQSKGVLVIASAGNSGTNRVACPACDPYAISVAATNWRDELATYSQYGNGLDISAPGGQCYSNTTAQGCIFSAVMLGYAGAVDGPLAPARYTYMNGTSMAAPQVTGAAAVVASKNPTLRGSALRTRLINTADDKGTAGYDTKFGAGRLNVHRAVTNTTAPAGK